jgi:hypothetical protein
MVQDSTNTKIQRRSRNFRSVSLIPTVLGKEVSMKIQMEAAKILS